MKKILSTIFAFILICVSMVNPVFSLNYDNVVYGEIKEVFEDTDIAWYKDAKEFVISEWIMQRQITKRISNTGNPSIMEYIYKDFFGERNITRAEVATVVSRYDGNENTIYGYQSSTCDAFTDVPDGKWLTPAVQWASDNGIVEGVGGKYFAPDRTITREEFAAILYRYTQYKNIACDTSFDYGDGYADSEKVSSWAEEAMRWAIGTGLISGKPGGLIAPQDKITRAEVAMIIYRYNNTVLAHRDNLK